MIHPAEMLLSRIVQSELTCTCLDFSFLLNYNILPQQELDSTLLDEPV